MKARMQKFVLLFGLAIFGITRAGEAQQVRAELSQDYAAVGQPVRLNISVTGGRGAQVPQQLNIDGIDARFVGKSEQMQWQMGKGGVNSSATSIYSYIIVPLRQGEFTIPAIPMVVAGKTVTTSPLKLSVSGGRGNVPVLPAIPVPQRQKEPTISSAAGGPSDPALGARIAAGRVQDCIWRFNHSEEKRLCRRGRSG